MTHHRPVALATIAAALLVVSLTPAAQDRFTLKSPNGIAFSEFKGYDAWQVISPSQPENGGVKVILGNPLMMNAYRDGFPGNANTIPDGAAMAKIEWSTQSHPLLPGAARVPDTLKKLQFMVKDAKRFPETDGWGYADFGYDAASASFTPMGNGPAFAKTACHQCHTRVKGRDFVFTSYAPQ
jgi:hypothetical protein